jgi:GT2 family glycosyltransferase
MPVRVPTKVGVVVPTLNAGERWAACLQMLSEQAPRPHRVLVVDSSSSDCTVELATRGGFEVRQISRGEFNHGATRQWAVELLDDCDVIVFLTQDSVLANKETLKVLVACFNDPDVAVAFGRQLPRPTADPIEAHARLFNYGSHSLRKNLAARAELGAKAYFCSNSFAAYRRSIILQLGGFRRDLILGEDAEFAARAVLAGYSNFYCAEAAVYHSHDYGTITTFQRYFDTGVFHARTPWLREQFGSHGGEGLRFVASEMGYLSRRAPSQIPRAIGQTIAKWLGYRLGSMECLLPWALKRRLSMNRSFWPPEG